jgi:hypothetical protein
MKGHELQYKEGHHSYNISHLLNCFLGNN